MSVLCCQVADLPLKLAIRTRPELAERPVALLGADETTMFVSSEARQYGVYPRMNAKQARVRCPEITLQPVDSSVCHAAQGAFLDVVTEWALPTEQLGMGSAYVDLHHVAEERSDAEGLAAELGRNVRKALDLAPSLGWDHGKFTARAAATQAQPGRMRLVERKDEVTFLSPLPVSLLPLAEPVLQQLTWLGIRDLGSFAHLPSAAVYQRFGKEGRMAQQWAKGRDTRPVRDTVRASFAPIAIPIDPPTALLPPVVEAIMAELAPHLHHMAGALEGCRLVRLSLDFIDGETRTLEVPFVEPISREESLKSALTHQLQTLNWPDELTHVTVTALESGELPAQQMTLFPEIQPDYSPLAALANRLRGRYGSIFFRGRLDEPTHSIAERRFSYDALVA